MNPNVRKPWLATGRPRVTVPEVLPIVNALYHLEPAGCCWHVVLDDSNTDRDFVLSTADEVARDGCPNGHRECVELAALLPQMSRTQIIRLSEEKRG